MINHTNVTKLQQQRLKNKKKRYHGLNDRNLHLKISSLMRLLCENANSDMLSYVSSHLRQEEQRAIEDEIVVGFVSKFFTKNHAHGQLLRGSIQHLAQSSRFRVILFCVRGVEDLSQPVLDAADQVVMIDLTLKKARDTIASYKLDALVFADSQSEAMSQFLLYNRLAPVQILFWGNPVTSGVENTVDYFITGERLERFVRGSSTVTLNLTDLAHDQYSEQHVLFRGQGIWYDPVQVPINSGVPNRADMGFQEDWHLYMCPQSVFKIHPIFDHVVRDILCNDRRAHVVFVQGRLKDWTERLQKRLNRSLRCDLDDNITFSSRVHFVRSRKI